MTNTFDSMNSSTLNTKNRYKHGITKNTIHADFIDKMINWFGQLKITNNKNKTVTGTIKCIKGWQISLQAVSQLRQHLQSDSSFSFLFTRQLNQDPLENFFSLIRQKGWFNDNPTPMMFSKLFCNLSS